MIKKSTHTVGVLPNGTKIEIEMFHMGDISKGKKIYIQGGTHGGEITLWIFNQLISKLDPNKINGQITFVPISNPTSWLQRQYFYTAGKFDWYDGKDWNRSFPGSPEGSLGERTSFLLSQTASQSDLVIDLHTSRNSIPFGIIGSKDYLDLVKTAYLKYNYLLDFQANNNLKQYEKTLLGQMCLKKIPNITFECGSHDSYQPQHVNVISDAILSLLSAFDITKEPHPIQNPGCQYYTSTIKYGALKGGFIKFCKQPGDSFSKGDTLYEMAYQDLNQPPDYIFAKENGIVIKTSPTHIHWPGDEVMEIVKKESLIRLA